jgi:epoxide hydrolase-like predicted phosphatase
MTSAVTIDAVVFDFGGVFTRSPFDALHATCIEMGVDPDLALSVVFGPYDQDTDHPWHRVERGELSLGDYRTAVREEAERSGFTMDPMEVLNALASGGSDGGVIRVDMMEVVTEVRASGRKTGLLTNNAAELRELWRPLMPLDELFDVVVDSSEVGMRKPSAAIFELTLAQLGGVAPAATAFLDDAPGNITGATAVGLHGILVTNDYQDAMAELRALLAG